MSQLIRLVVVDDHVMVRDGIRALLSRTDELEVVGEASDARQAIAIVDQVLPDVVILDMALQGSSGLTVARELMRRDHKCRILFVSMFMSEDAIAEALVVGALGYIGKDRPAVELIEAVRTVGRGHRYLAAEISERILDLALRAANGTVHINGPLAVLSVREREVFEVLMQGMSTEGIARHLGISRRTVETHRAHLLKKLGLHSLAELLRFALQNELLRV